MKQSAQGERTSVDQLRVEMMGLLHEPMAGRHWVSSGQRPTWRPPTDVFETDDCIIVKVEIAGMEHQDFAISLDGKKLTISGVRHDPAAKLAYQQMEILYGHFETHVHIPRAVDDEGIEAIYQNGFLRVRLPKAKLRQVPVVNRD